MSDEGEQFEAAGAGASLTYPLQAGALRKGGHVMIKGCPCKIVDISVSKTGKHGHAKAHIVAIDVFTNKKLEDLCPTSHNVEVPNIARTEYTLLSVDEDDGSVSVLDGGDTKDDLNLPTDLSGNREDICKEIIDAFNDGKNIQVTVMKALDKEKIIAWKEDTTAPK